MRGLLEAYDRLANSAPQGFIFRAVFPWIFVIVLNVAIYETLIPDGRSLIDRFAMLHDNLQIYAALAIVTAVAAVAGISDGIVDQLVNPYRLQRWLNTDEQVADPGATKDFEVEFLRRMIRAEESDDKNSKSSAPVLTAIDRAKTTVHRSANLVLGFGASIVVSTIELAQYQENLLTSMGVIAALWILMAGSFFLALRQMKTLAGLDSIIRRAEPPASAKPAPT
jgi:hypothetical protein